MQKTRGADRPSRIIVSDRDPARLKEIRRVHAELASDAPVHYVLTADARDNDAALASLRPGSLIVNATGLGKDAPGSPLTDAAVFPEGAMRGTSIIAATSFSSPRPARRPRTARCKSRTAGPISCTAGCR